MQQMLSPLHLRVLLSYGLLMCAVCMLACTVPTGRALRVEPTEALRRDERLHETVAQSRKAARTVIRTSRFRFLRSRTPS